MKSQVNSIRPNQEIRQAKADIPWYMIARKLGIHENTLKYRINGKEMNVEEKVALLEVIEKIKKELQETNLNSISTAPIFNRNQDIKSAKNGIPNWAIAEKLGVSEMTWYRMLRKNLSTEERHTILSIIADLRNEKSEIYAKKILEEVLLKEKDNLNQY